MTTVQPQDGNGIALGVYGQLVGCHIRRASAVFVNDFGRAVAGTGMRQALFGILSIVAANPGINQGSVGRALGIQRANMVSLVNELTGRGLVLRESTDNRRAFALTLTASGERMIATCIERLHRHEAALLSALSRDERATLVAALGRIEAKDA